MYKFIIYIALFSAPAAPKPKQIKIKQGRRVDLVSVQPQRLPQVGSGHLVHGPVTKAGRRKIMRLHKFARDHSVAALEGMPHLPRPHTTKTQLEDKEKPRKTNLISSYNEASCNVRDPGHRMGFQIKHVAEIWGLRGYINYSEFNTIQVCLHKARVLGFLLAIFHFSGLHRRRS